MDHRIPKELTKDAPAIRAAQLKQNISEISSWEEPLQSEVLEVWGDDGIAVIQKASRMEWLPLEFDIILVERISELAGEEGMRRLCGSISDTTETHLLKPIFQGGAAVFGVNGKSVLRLAPPVFDMLYKNCGKVQKDHLEKTTGSMRLKNLPEVLLESPTYLSVIGMALQTMIHKFSKNGEVRHEMEGEESVYFASW